MEAAKSLEHGRVCQAISQLIVGIHMPINPIFPTIYTANIQKDLWIPYGKFYGKLILCWEVEKFFKFPLSVKKF